MLLAEGIETGSCHTPRTGKVCEGIPDGFFSSWYKAQGRSFPWREEETSPYGVLLAEVLLKQTRAEMVATVWPTLVRTYPSATDLASANPEVLYRHISCLGFGHQRTASLQQLSVALVEAGEIPSRPEDLMDLPHVGIYSAHAVACFAFNRRVPVVDLSIVRVLSRLAGIEAPSDIRRAPMVWEIAWSLLPGKEIKEHNYGLLDFAAGICKARSPRCGECPVTSSCSYAAHLAGINEKDTRPGDP